MTMLLAPENNLGFDTADDGRVSLVCRPDAAVVASYRDFFDALSSCASEQAGKTLRFEPPLSA